MNVETKSSAKSFSILSENLDNLSKYIISQREYIYSIEDKLHSIVNRKMPEEKSKAQLGEASSSSIQDFASAFNTEVEYVYQNNCRLERILSHLQEII